MKITSLVASGILEFNDLGSRIKGVSPQIRDIKLNPGESKYLVETSEVLLSAQDGDIYRFKAASKISVNDTATVANGATIVMNHNFGFVPQVTVINTATGAVVPVSAAMTVVSNAALTTTTVTNVSLGTVTLAVRVS